MGHNAQLSREGHNQGDGLNMGKNIRKLSQISGPSLAPPLGGRPGINAMVEALLGLKNGFYAFESALHVFPAGEGLGTTGVQEWNSRSLWRHSYGKLVDGMFFFAEDIFGGQFCVKDGAIYGFDPETADVTLIGQDLEEWAQAVLDDYDLQTGYSIAQEWQLQNGPLSPSDRLMPKIPFVLGGAFDISNLVAIERARGMRTRGNLATQIHDLPDGSQIRFDIVD